MLRLWVTVGIALIATTSWGEEFSSRPPPEFASGPLLAPVEIFPLGLGEVNSICRDHIKLDADYDYSQRIPACVIFENDRGMIEWEERSSATACLIFYASDIITSPADYESVINHETAHCRGWPPDHPGEIRLDAEARTSGFEEVGHLGP